MAFKEKLIGVLLIAMGILPFLLKIESINKAIGKYTFILPGEYLYQIVIVILGLLLLVRLRQQIPDYTYKR